MGEVDTASDLNPTAAVTTTDEPHSRREIIASTPKYMIFSAVIASLGSFNNGYNTSVFNIPENVIRFCNGVVPPDHKQGGLPDCIPMDNFQWGMAVAMFAIGGLIGGVLGGPGITRLGRRGAMIWNNLFLIVGSLLVSTTSSVTQLVVGRTIVGIGCGGACVISPTYLSEIATVEARGALGAMNQLFIVLGILVVECLGLGLSSPPVWRVLTIIPALVGIGQMIGCLFINETPRYLVLQGRISDAEHALKRLRGGRDVSEELYEIMNPQGAGDGSPRLNASDSDSDKGDAAGQTKDGDEKQADVKTPDTTRIANPIGETKGEDGRRHSVEGASPPTSESDGDGEIALASDTGEGGGGGRGESRFRPQGTNSINVWQLLRGRGGGPYHLFKPLLFASVFSAVQQLSGINGVMFYSTSIFDKLFSNSQTPQHITVGTGGLNVVMTVITMGLVDRLGRKILTLISAGGMTVSSIVIVIASAANSDVLVIVFVFLFIAFFAVGLGVTPWLFMTETFPTYAQSAASSWCMILNWFCNFIVGLIFPSLQSGLGDATFVPFAAITGAFTLFVLFFVPETKGKPVDEVISMLNQSDFGRAAAFFRRMWYKCLSCVGIKRSMPADQTADPIPTPVQSRRASGVVPSVQGSPTPVLVSDQGSIPKSPRV
ncbi:Bifunctional purine biosynthesis protein PurH [Dimargaris cristalligena]|nr:Bifunctional purine biosynthesis protein PurH [Dimargaris cristalligena]